MQPIQEEEEVSIEEVCYDILTIDVVTEKLQDMYLEPEGEIGIAEFGRTLYLLNEDLARNLHKELSYWIDNVNNKSKI